MSYRFGDILSWLKDLSPRWVNQECLPPDSLDLPLSAVAELGRADRRAVAFFFSKEYQTELLLTQAGVVITGDAFVEPVAKISPPCWSSAVWIACRDPYLALALISQRFRNGSSEPTGVHPTVVLGPGVALGRGVGIGPFCTVGAGSQIGEGCILFPGVHVYPNTVIGNRVRIHSGAVIGADGFGYAPVVRDGSPEGHCKIEHLGRVVIGDDVEIGANTTIDRGTLGDTVIEDGAKIDNQCQIGHNAKVCRGAIICGNTALAGSSEVGAFAYIGGVTGISNQVRIGEGARVGAGTIVSKDVSPGHKVAGNPQRSFAEHFRAHALLNKLMKKKMSD